MIDRVKIWRKWRIVISTCIHISIVVTAINFPIFCEKSQQLCQELQSKIQTRTGFCVYFHPEDVLLGYLDKNPNSMAINTLIMVTKLYLYSNSRKGSPINIGGLILYFKTVYNEENCLHYNRIPWWKMLANEVCFSKIIPFSPWYNSTLLVHYCVYVYIIM